MNVSGINPSLVRTQLEKYSQSTAGRVHPMPGGGIAGIGAGLIGGKAGLGIGMGALQTVANLVHFPNDTLASSRPTSDSLISPTLKSRLREGLSEISITAFRCAQENLNLTIIGQALTGLPGASLSLISETGGFRATITGQDGREHNAEVETGLIPKVSLPDGSKLEIWGTSNQAADIPQSLRLVRRQGDQTLTVATEKVAQASDEKPSEFRPHTISARLDKDTRLVNHSNTENFSDFFSLRGVEPDSDGSRSILAVPGGVFTNSLGPILLGQQYHAPDGAKRALSRSANSFEDEHMKTLGPRIENEHILLP